MSSVLLGVPDGWATTAERFLRKSKEFGMTKPLEILQQTLDWLRTSAFGTSGWILIEETEFCDDAFFSRLSRNRSLPMHNSVNDPLKFYSFLFFSLVQIWNMALTGFCQCHYSYFSSCSPSFKSLRPRSKCACWQLLPLSQRQAKSSYCRTGETALKCVCVTLRDATLVQRGMVYYLRATQNCPSTAFCFDFQTFLQTTQVPPSECILASGMK